MLERYNIFTSLSGDSERVTNVSVQLNSGTEYIIRLKDFDCNNQGHVFE